MTTPLPAIPPRVSIFHRGYDVAAVDALVLRVNAVLVGDPGAEPITAEQLRTIAFPAQRGGYQETAVDAIIDQLIALLSPGPAPVPGTVPAPPTGAAPAAAAFTDPVAAHLPDELRDPRFRTTKVSQGYVMAEVDALIDWLTGAFALTDIRDRASVGRILEGLRATTVHTSTHGYVMSEVDTWWEKVDQLLAAAVR